MCENYDKKSIITNNELIAIGPKCSSPTSSIEDDFRALHEEIEVKCFYSGTATLMIGEKIVTVKAGDIVVINPYEFHTTIERGEGDDIGLYHLFMIPLDIFFNSGVDDLNLRKLILENNTSFKTLHQNDTRMYKILTRVVKEYEGKKTAYKIAICGLIMEFFAILIRKGLCQNEIGGSSNGNLSSYYLIEPAMRCIRDRYQEDLTVEELASLCNISKGYFCRVFKAVTGKTAMEYLGRYRLKIADALLQDGDKNIADIAESCGFESVSYFCRSYKKRYDRKPSERRKNSTKKDLC